MSKLKYHFANSLHKHKRKLVFPLSLAIGTTVGINNYNPEDKPEYHMDNYSNDITEIQVDYLNKEITEINNKYASLQSELPSIKLQEIEHGEDYAAKLFGDFNNKLNSLHQDADDFEYKLLSSGISEKDMQDILITFNGTDVTELVDNIDTKDISSVNDVIGNINPLKYNQDEEGRSDYVTDLKKELQKANSTDNMSEALMSFLSAFLTYQLSLIGLVLLTILPEPKKLNEWRKNNGNRNKKKLPITSKNKSNKRSL